MNGLEYQISDEKKLQEVLNALRRVNWSFPVPESNNNYAKKYFYIIKKMLLDSDSRLFEFMYISNACVFPSDWTTENLMRTHNSRPYNPDLANTFFRAGYIESWGRGIQKICEECDLIGAKIPEYSILGNDITVKFTAVVTSKVFKRTNDVRKEKGMNTKVLELIKAQTDISLSEIAGRLGVSYKTVQRAVADLKKIGIIERVGGRRKGYWRVKEND